MRERVVALDSDVWTYLMQANTLGYDPAQDPDKNLAREKSAVFQVFLYVDRIVILPTVKCQVARITDADRRSQHQGFGQVHLDEPLVDEASVVARARNLNQYHKGGQGEEEDCRIVAEAELANVDVLLSFDTDLRTRLTPHARLPLQAPFEYWKTLAIPRGTKPRREPDRCHPLYTAAWWHW